MEPLSFTPGETIIEMHSAALGMFFILDGECSVTVPSSSNDGVDIVCTLRPGEYFGELSLVDGALAKANVVAKTMTVCQVLYKQDYDLLKATYTELDEQMRAAVEKRSYDKISPFINVVPLLRNLDTALVRSVVKALERYPTPTGFEPIVQQGSVPPGLFFVASGGCEACVSLSSLQGISDAFILREEARGNGRSRRVSRSEASSLQGPPLANQVGPHASVSSAASRRTSYIGSRRGSAATGGSNRSARPSVIDPALLGAADTFLKMRGSWGNGDGMGADEHTYMLLGPGDTFGAHVLLHPGSESANSVWPFSSGCELFLLRRDKYEKIIEEFPGLRARLESHEKHSIDRVCCFLATRVALFEDCSCDLIKAVVETSQRRVCQPKQVLVFVSRKSEGLFVVLKGKCLCYKPPDPSEEDGEAKHVRNCSSPAFACPRFIIRDPFRRLTGAHDLCRWPLR